MESGRFTGFSENAPFGKPGILRGDRGRIPPFSSPLNPPGREVFPGISGTGNERVTGNRNSYELLMDNPGFSSNRFSRHPANLFFEKFCPGKFSKKKRQSGIFPGLFPVPGKTILKFYP
ncbi:MAG: hypothetical protein WC379_01840 [Methanoregula sp.]|jgi:hypothetical protein